MHEAPTDTQLVPVVLDDEEPAADVSRETSVGPYVAGGQVPFPPVAEVMAEFDAAHPRRDRLATDPLAVAALQEAPPALSPARRLRLEALTAQWVRDVREGGPGPDDTLLVPGALPPVPPRRQEIPMADDVARLADALVPPAHLTGQRPETRAADHAAAVRALEAAQFPARVHDWESRHDPASLAFAAKDVLTRAVPVQRFVLERGPVLDQGTTPPLSLAEASGCAGFAGIAAANVLELASRPAHAIRRGRDEEDDYLGAAAARALYHRAQDLDHVHGNTVGTSVLAVMKAGQEAGYWDRYVWGLRGTRDVAQAHLQLHSPVVLGVPWDEGLDDPDAHGVIRPGGRPLGGHAVCSFGIVPEVSGLAHAPGPYFAIQQSRGPAEGVDGVVYLHHTHLARMLAGQGEAGIPLSRWAVTS